MPNRRIGNLIISKGIAEHSDGLVIKSGRGLVVIEIYRTDCDEADVDRTVMTVHTPPLIKPTIDPER